MTWKSYAAVSGAGLLATYLVSTPPTGAPSRPAGTRSPAPARATQAFDISEEASRLRVRPPAATDYHDPARNPFRFGGRPPASLPARVAEAPAPPDAAPPELAPQPPPIRLSGIQTSSVDGKRERTAILITPGGIVTAREGETVGADARVVRIDEDAVEIVGADGTARRLMLRP